MFMSTTGGRSLSRYWRSLLCGVVLAGLLFYLPLTSARAASKRPPSMGKAASLKLTKSTSKVKSKKYKGMQARAKVHGPKRHYAEVHSAKRHRLAHRGRWHKPRVGTWARYYWGPTAVAQVVGPDVIAPSVTTPTDTASSGWRMTGKYPLIAGKWQGVVNKVGLVTVRQNGNKFVANCTDNEGVERRWRGEGTISKDGEITISYNSQVLRTGKLDPNGKMIRGRDKGGHDFTWELLEPYAK